MRLVHASSLVFLLVAAAVGAEPAKPLAIRFPEPAAPAKAAAPVAPGAVTKLAADEYYVIDSDQELFARAIPNGIVTIAVETGPLVVKAKFAGGGNKIERREFKGKFLYFIEGKSSGRVDLIIVPKGVTTDAEIITKSIDVTAGQGPQPPPVPPQPKPEPIPVPPKPVDPAPIPDAGFRVLIVFETDQTLTAAQHSVIYGKTIRDYLDANCVVEPDGKTRAYRIWDKDVQVGAESKIWRDAFARPHPAIPWIVVSNGKTGFEGPLPANVADTLTLLKKHVEGK